MRWTWVPAKAAANRVKHGLSLETAVLVFDDPFHASKPDPHSDGDRWHTIGLVGLVLLLVIHTWPEETESEPIGRIISARKARHTKGKPMKKATSKRLTRAQRAELKSLAALRDEAIDTSDGSCLRP